MPNKDSFTFSDKLKKSKSLPLSKRIRRQSQADSNPKSPTGFAIYNSGRGGLIAAAIIEPQQRHRRDRF